MKKKYKLFLLNLSIVIIIFLIDRVTKYHVINLFENFNDQKIFITSFLNIYLIWNEGIAFGLFSSGNEKIYDFITLLIFIINLIIIYILFNLNDVRKYFFIIVLGGSLGNLFDRLIYNAVPDFIDFHINNFHWFIFNPADIFITIGITCLILDEIFFKNQRND